MLQLYAHVANLTFGYLSSYASQTAFIALRSAPRRAEPVFICPPDSRVRRAARAYYEKLMKNDSEILDTAYVAALTGYGRDTVLRWVAAGKLIPFCKLGPRYLYSKENLLDFFTSDSYNRIPVKSHLHIRHIKSIKLSDMESKGTIE